MNTGNSVEVCKVKCGIKCISWSAIVAGALVALGLTFLLNLFSTAIGLTIYSVDAEGVSTLKIGGMLGFAIGIIASMFFAGWVAGYFGKSHCFTKCCGALYGFTTWCLSLVLAVLLMMPFSHFVSNYTHYLAHTVASDVVTATSDTAGTVERKIPAKPTPSTANTSGEAEETLGDLSLGAYVLFIMFFLGALAATCGGHVGVVCCCRKEGCCGTCGPNCQCGKCK